MANRYLVTSALPYANGSLHLGHLAGAYLPADIYVRYLRLMGKQVLWVCGSDEHGAAITIRAKKEGINPREIIDKYHNIIKDSFEQFNISFDMYHRTSEPSHHETSQTFFKKILEKGEDLEVQTSQQYYDPKFDQFLADRYITGTCPKCKTPGAYGDQCESCGSDLNPTDLIDPVSTLSGDKPELKETKHWFFKLQNHQDWLRDWIGEGILDGKKHHDPSVWKNHVKGQCLSWLDGGLHPRSITRDLDWGIPVPVEGAEGKVLYVWFDAPIGYISATKAICAERGENWEDYWKHEDTELVHFIGKDNIVFHCIIFPAMLKAHGGYNLPVNVPANQFLNFEDKKFSTSKGWGINLDQYLEEFKSFDGAVDALRYVLTRIMPENKDANFKWSEFVDLYDNELVNNLGNFVNRVMVLSHKFLGGKASASTVRDENFDRVKGLFHAYQQQLEGYQFKVALQTLMEISSLGNTYLQEQAPWSLAKADPNDPKIASTLGFCAEIVRILQVSIAPFIPETAEKMGSMLNLPTLENGDLAKVAEALTSGAPLIEAGHAFGAVSLLFKKINDRKDDTRKKLIEAQIAKLEAIEEAEKPANPLKETIQFDDFTKIDIRTGEILAAEKVPKTDKLLKIEVDLGFEKRTIVSGIALHFDAEKLKGQKVLVVANLAPRKLRGIESKGMILMAEDENGKLGFVSPNKGWPNGQSVN